MIGKIRLEKFSYIIQYGTNFLHPLQSYTRFYLDLIGKQQLLQTIDFIFFYCVFLLILHAKNKIQ